MQFTPNYKAKARGVCACAGGLEKSLTDWEGQGEQSQWSSLERKLKGCTNDHRLRESFSKFRNSIYKGMKMQGVSW